MKLKDLKPTDYVLYVDLDGVLANLQGRVEEILGPIETTPDGGNWVNSDEIWKKLIAMNEPDFSTLDKLSDADTLWNYVKQYKPHILTASGEPAKKNAAEKREWVQNNLSNFSKVYTVVGSEEKAKYAKPEAILIDDRMKSIGPWRKSGGIGILHTSADDTIKQLKKLGL